MSATQTTPRPWLEDGKDVGGLKTTEQALIDANLNFRVDKIQTLGRCPAGFEVIDGVQVPVYKEIQGDYFYTVRMDTQQILGCVGKSYTVVQTQDAVKFFDAALGEGACCIDSVGSLGKGGRIWLAAKVPSRVIISKNDIIDRYILLAIGHDGHWGVNALFTGIRPLCINTVSAAMKGASKDGRQIIKVKHTTNAEKNLKNALVLVGQEERFWKHLAPAFQRMAQVEITAAGLDGFLEKTFPATKKDPETGLYLPAKQTQDRRDMVKWAFENSPGAKEAGATVWGAYNAYTWWNDHSANALEAKTYEGMPTEGARKVKGSAWENTTFASGAKMREKALAVALSMV